MSDSAAPWTAACRASLSFIISQSLLKLMSIESVIPYNHLILCRLLLFLPSICPSIRVFSNESAVRIRWPKYWSFSFNISLCWGYYKMPSLICWINVFLPSHIKRDNPWAMERVPVCGLLGTGPHGRRWAVGKRVKLHLYLFIYLFIYLLYNIVLVMPYINIWNSSNEVDETGAYYTEWSKPERKTPIQYTNAYIWNLERW